MPGWTHTAARGALTGLGWGLPGGWGLAATVVTVVLVIEGMLAAGSGRTHGHPSLVGFCWWLVTGPVCLLGEWIAEQRTRRASEATNPGGSGAAS
jgi:hypothetical protein